MKNNLTLNIKNVSISPAVMLAPMASVSDLAFREICLEHNASYTCTEMVSAKALCYNDKKTASILKKGTNPAPFAVQIFGSDPKTMAEGAKIALEISGASVLDINMGCPMPKIVSNGEGSALMKSPELAFKIIEAIKNAVDVPVTVKHRIGWNSSSINGVEFAKNAEIAGADAICVHGRTATQLYSGKADRQVIAQIKKAVGIPVFANGDICSADDAVSMLKDTGADGIAIARGALGNPWLFDEIYARLNNLPKPKEISLNERLDTALKQIEKTVLYKGERIALLEARKHLCYYLKYIPGSKAFKVRACSIVSLSEAQKLIDEMKETFDKYGTLNPLQIQTRGDDIV